MSSVLMLYMQRRDLDLYCNILYNYSYQKHGNNFRPKCCGIILIFGSNFFKSVYFFQTSLFFFSNHNIFFKPVCFFKPVYFSHVSQRPTTSDTQKKWHAGNGCLSCQVERSRAFRTSRRPPDLHRLLHVLSPATFF